MGVQESDGPMTRRRLDRYVVECLSSQGRIMRSLAAKLREWDARKEREADTKAFEVAADECEALAEMMKFRENLRP